MNNRIKLAIGTAIATGAGYLAGILTAPKSGKDTRDDIQKQSARVRKESEKKLKEISGELSELIVQVKAKVKTAEIGTKAEIHKALDRATAAKTKAREILSAFHEGESDDKDLEQSIKDAHKAVDHLRTYLDKTQNTK